MMQARTMVVLAALVAGMSITSLLLVLLEPNPVAPPLAGVLFNKQDNAQGTVTQAEGGKAYQLLAETAASVRPWTRVVIQDSGAQRGSAASIESVFGQLPGGHAAYHFVINNGTEQEDGAIEIGYRWNHQFDAVEPVEQAIDTGGTANQSFARVSSENQAFTGTIAVCVIGDSDQQELTADQEDSLIWLVKTLRQQLDTDLAVEINLGDAPSGQRRSWLLKQKLRRG